MTNNQRFPGNDIHDSSFIEMGVGIGTGNRIGAFCIIGTQAEWKGKDIGVGSVIIGNNNTITGLVTIDSGVDRITTVMNNCYIMKHAHVGHDAIIMSDVTIACGSKIGGHSIIGKGTNLGLNCVIHQKCTVPEGCMIGALAFIGKKTEMKPYSKYAGVPAKYIGSNDRHL